METPIDEQMLVELKNIHEALSHAVARLENIELMMITIHEKAKKYSDE